MKLGTRKRNSEMRTRPLGGWLILLLLCGYLIFSHGCHGGDVDDELCPPAARETRNSKSEIRTKSQTGLIEAKKTPGVGSR